MAKRHKQRRGRKRTAPPSPGRPQSSRGGAVLAWGALVALVLLILMILETVKERLTGGFRPDM